MLLFALWQLLLVCKVSDRRAKLLFVSHFVFASVSVFVCLFVHVRLLLSQFLFLQLVVVNVVAVK